MAKGGEHALETQQAADEFIAQFSWVRRLQANLNRLRQSGHYGYRSFVVSIPLHHGPDHVRSRALSTLAELQAWEQNLAHERQNNYFLNFFRISTAWELVEGLETRGVTEAVARSIISHVCPSMAQPPAFVAQFVTSLSQIYTGQKVDGAASILLSLTSLMRFGAALEAMWTGVTPFTRQLSASVVSAAAAAAGFIGFPLVGLVSVDDAATLLQTALSAYALLGFLPEGPEMCFCSPETEWEDVSNLILRWARAHEYGRECRLYSLVGVGRLPFEIQTLAAQAIRDAMVQARAKLLLFSGPEAQHLAAQYAHCKVSLAPLPMLVLKTVGLELSQTYTAGVSVYTSMHAGAGKSLAISTQAKRLAARYVYLPLATMDGLLTRLQTKLTPESSSSNMDSPSAPILLHLDLMDTLPLDFDVVLLQLIFFNSVAEECFFNSKAVIIAVEVAAGDLLRRLPTCMMLPQVMVEASAASFYNDPRLLAPTACDKMTYLIHLLAELEPQALCSPYERIAAAMNVSSEGHMSYWSIWSFVNVASWQLRALQADHSMLQDCAKHAGVLRLVLKSACEFTTRQEAKKERRADTLLVACASNPILNGSWDRSLVLFDDQPVFRHRQRKLNLFYRSRSPADDAASTGGQGCWIIGELVGYDTEVLAYSTSAEMLATSWRQVAVHREVTGVRVMPAWAAQAEDGLALSIKGLDPEHDGLFLQIPMTANYITHMKFDRPHRSMRLHPERAVWEISQDVNGKNMMAHSQSADIFAGSWTVIDPAKTLEVQIQVVNAERRDALTRQGLPEEVELRSEWELALHRLMKWSESSHDCLLVSPETGVARALSLKPQIFRDSLPLELKSLLHSRHIFVDNLDQVTDKHYQTLRELTNMAWTVEEARQLMDGRYVLTGDNLMKMMAIYIRARCAIPVVLMGECGCGKTMLIQYLCAWLKVKLMILNVHGGTSENDILAVFAQAKAHETTTGQEVYCFLDEINTCPHMGLLYEVICKHSLLGVPLPSRIHVLAALNPYRRREQGGSTNTPGLVYRQGDADRQLQQDDMAALVYRVHPIPLALHDFVFDFGYLTKEKEFLYVKSMVNEQLPTASPLEMLLIAELIQISQMFIRKVEGDPSAASLRDVRRCLRLVLWFLTKVVPHKKETKISPLACATTLGLAFAYFYRLSKSNDRGRYWDTCRKYPKWLRVGESTPGFERLERHGGFEQVVIQLQRRFCDNVIVEDGIAMNQSLAENLFVVIICILNRIPCFVVGKPGSSKTLTLQVIASNLQGQRSRHAFWRRFPAIYIFQYQCSPMSHGSSIQHQFEMAKRYQRHAQDVLTVLLLDEVGLAELSPDMPLKVLHAMLVEPPISIVGLSNWTLDAAKMNRAICVQRPEPGKDDIFLTGERIVGDIRACSDLATEENLTPWLRSLATAYFAVYTEQAGRDFIGMRDYYSLIKQLRQQVTASKHGLSSELLTRSLCRNFGGKRELLLHILRTFHQACFHSPRHSTLPPSTRLVSENLQDQSSRNLMLLTENAAALALLFATGLLNRSHTAVLMGSTFVDDQNELHLVQQINQVRYRREI